MSRPGSAQEPGGNRARYGINTYSFTQTLGARDCLKQLANLGYHRFEIMLIPGHFWAGLDGDAGRREIESLVLKDAVQILTLNQPNLDVNLSSVVPEMRQHSCGVIASAIELAASWNAKGVVINPGKCNPVFPPPTKTLTDCFRRSLEVLVPIARKANVELIVKNHPLSYLYRAIDLRLFFDEFGWNQVGIGYDFANGHFAREEPEAVLQLRDHLSFMYAADTALDMFHHAQIGTGTVPFERIATMLRGAKLCPPTILETWLETHSSRSTPASSISTASGGRPAKVSGARVVSRPDDTQPLCGSSQQRMEFGQTL